MAADQNAFSSPKVANPITIIITSVSQSVRYFTVPPRAHPSAGSQSGSAAPGLTQVPRAPLLWGEDGVARVEALPYNCFAYGAFSSVGVSQGRYDGRIHSTTGRESAERGL